MQAQSALIIGATGNVGRNVLRELIASPQFNRVGEYGRRLTAKDQLPAGADKLEQKVIDFEKLGDSGLKDGKWDVVFITLGTTRATAGSAEMFEKIDREYVIDAARAAKSDDPAHKQRLIYLSSTGANSKSSFLYPRSKGLTEQGLTALGYSDTIVFRPALLANVTREDTRIGEKLASYITAGLSYITASAEIDISLLGRAMRIAGELGSGGLPPAAGASKVDGFTLITNKGAIGLGNTGK